MQVTSSNSRIQTGVQKVAAAFLDSPVNGELVLLHVATGTFSGLSGVGLAIWRALDDTADPQTIKAQLCDRYAIAPEVCDREVDAFLDTLLTAGLLAKT